MTNHYDSPSPDQLMAFHRSGGRLSPDELLSLLRHHSTRLELNVLHQHYRLRHDFYVPLYLTLDHESLEPLVHYAIVEHHDDLPTTPLFTRPLSVWLEVLPDPHSPGHVTPRFCPMRRDVSFSPKPGHRRVAPKPRTAESPPIQGDPGDEDPSPSPCEDGHDWMEYEPVGSHGMTVRRVCRRCDLRSH